MDKKQMHIAMLISQRYAEAHSQFKEASHNLNKVLYIGSGFLSKEDADKVRETISMLNENASKCDFYEAEKYAEKEFTETLNAV